MTKTLVPDKVRQKLSATRDDVIKQLDILNAQELSAADAQYRDSLDEMLTEIEASLGRLTDGTYGLCTNCGLEIDQTRIEQLPHVGLCLVCKKAANSSPHAGGDSPDVGQPAVTGTAESNGEPVRPAESEGAGGAPHSPEPLAILRSSPVASVKVDRLRASKTNPRTDIGDVSGLAGSIASVGLMHPLIVTPNGDGFTVVAGHRRLAAVKTLGWTEIPVDVWEVDDMGAEVARLVENLHRTDLRPIEEGRAYKRLTDSFGLTQREIAERVGREQSHVSKRMALVHLPDKAIELVDSGGITLEEAGEFLKLKAHPKALEAAVKELKPDSPYSTVESVVGKQLRKISNAETEAKLRKKVKDEGLKVISDKAYYAISHDKRGKVGKHDLNVPLKEHQAEECHRVQVLKGDSYGSRPRLVHLCIDVSRHKKSGASELKAEATETSARRVSSKAEEERLREQELVQSLAAVAEDRRAFAAQLLKDKAPAKDDVLTMLGLAIPRAGYNAPGQRDICSFLGIKVKGSSWQEGPAVDALVAYTAESPDNRNRVLMANAVLILDAILENATYEDGTPWLDCAPYVEYLEKKGYAVTDVEIEELGKEAIAADKAKGKKGAAA